MDVTNIYHQGTVLSDQSYSVVLKGASLISQGQDPSEDARMNMIKSRLAESIYCRFQVEQ